MLPQTNAWAAIGGALTIIVVFVSEALVRFFATGNAWPLTTQGWLMIILPAVFGGILAALTPNLSYSEYRFGYRKTGPQDAPMLNTTSEHLRGVGK